MRTQPPPTPHVHLPTPASLLFCAGTHQQQVALEEFEALESQVLREVGNCSPRVSPSQHPPASSSGKKQAGGARGSGSSPSVWQQSDREGAAFLAAASLQNRLALTSGGRLGSAAAGAGAGAELELAGGRGDPEAEEAQGDVFDSDEEGEMHCAIGDDSQAQAAAAGSSHPLARRTVTFAGSLGAGPLAPERAPQVAAAAAAAGAQLAPAQRAATAGGLLAPRVYPEKDEEEEEAEMLAEVCKGL